MLGCRCFTTPEIEALDQEGLLGRSFAHYLAENYFQPVGRPD